MKRAAGVAPWLRRPELSRFKSPSEFHGGESLAENDSRGTPFDDIDQFVSAQAPAVAVLVGVHLIGRTGLGFGKAAA